MLSCMNIKLSFLNKLYLEKQMNYMILQNNSCYYFYKKEVKNE